MIMFTDRELKVGSVEWPKEYLTDAFENKHPPQPFLVVREATHEEWVEDVIKNREGDTNFNSTTIHPFYYEMRTD